MTPAEQAAFDAANEIIHPVETQWHYPILTTAGFEPITSEGDGFTSPRGFVRSYKYRHADGRTVRYTTGYNADYWTSSDGAFGYWSDLKEYLRAKG